MYEPLSLRKNFSWTFVANIIYSACQWGMLIVLAKLGGPDIVGKYSLALAVVVPITIFGRLTLRTVFATDVKNSYLFSEYFALRLATTVLTLLIITFLAFLFYHDETDYVLVILLMGLGYGALSIKELFQTVMQKAERMDWVAISKILQGIFSVILFAIAIYFFKSLIMGVLALLLARSIVIFIYDLPRSEKIRPAICNDNGPLLRYPRRIISLVKLIWLSFPLGVTSTLIAFQTSIPRYFIKHYYDEAYLGYFSAMSVLLVFGTMIVQALGDSACPRLARYYVENGPAYIRLVIKLILVGFFVGICGIIIAALFGKFFLRIFFTAEYAQYHKEFIWIVFCGTFTFVISFLGYSLSAARYFKTQVVVWLGIVIITTILCYLLIPKFGMKGAIWSMAISLILGCLFILIFSLHLVPKRKNCKGYL